MHDNSITINDSGPCYRLPGSQIAGSSRLAIELKLLNVGRMD